MVDDLNLKLFSDIIFLGDNIALNQSLADLAVQKIQKFLPEVFVTTLFQRFNSSSYSSFLIELQKSNILLKDVLIIKLYIDNADLDFKLNEVNIIDLNEFNTKIKELQTVATSSLAGQNPASQQPEPNSEPVKQ